MKCTILPGLPASGDPSHHFCFEQPSPWAEGLVVSFTASQGNTWVGNFQQGHGYATKLIEWPAANAVIVVASGAVYFVSLDHSKPWQCYHALGIDCILTPNQGDAVISTYDHLLMIGQSGQVVWRRLLAIDGIDLEVKSVQNEEISGMYCWDPPEGWSPFRVSRVNGTDLVPNSD
ncbi:hypothetical protein [Aeoliella sp. SH292]|uniref:hypothetical protein n=1 Tax=Aeoliella sp. SH292 TaxID=3454464 RepID=UPI003F990791